jgi:FkbM family methyltransferase
MNSPAKLLQKVMAKAGMTLIPSWRMDHRDAALHYQKLFRQYQVDLVLDVGANEGQFRDFLRWEVGYAGWIMSFEPAPEPAAILQRRAMSDPKWRILAQALGSEAGVQKLNIAGHSTFTSLRSPRFDQTKLGNAKRETIRSVDVEIVTLDEVLPDLVSVAKASRPFLKLDTQGYDLEVVRGATKTLSSIVALQAELSIVPLYEDMPNYIETIAALQAYGFQVSNFFPVASEANLRLLETDCVMVRPDRMVGGNQA